MKYQITHAASFLYDIGVSFYHTGTLKKKTEAIFDFYKTDGLTEEQKQKIKAWCPDAAFTHCRSIYAPEAVKTLILFPKAAFYRSKNEHDKNTL